MIFDTYIILINIVVDQTYFYKLIFFRKLVSIINIFNNILNTYSNILDIYNNIFIKYTNMSNIYNNMFNICSNITNNILKQVD